MVDYNKVFDLTKNLTVLYFEDDISFQKETTKIFEELFFKVDVVSNGIEGLNKYKEYYQKENKAYDLLITDLNMPHMNGIELVKEIYIIKKEQPIIVISAHDESKYLFELINIGIEQFLIKPLDFDILLKVFYDVSYKIVEGSNYKETVKFVPLKNKYSWDIEKFILLKEEKVIKLTKKETLFLALLIKNKDKISTNQEIINYIYEEPHLVSHDSLKTLISRLRKKIPNQTIDSIYSFGYRLIF